MVVGDLPFLQRLFRTTRLDIERMAISAEDKAKLYHHQFHAQHVHYQRYFSDADFLIVLDGKVRIGRLYVLDGSDEIRVIDIALLDEHRGKGVGTKLMMEILNRARQKNLPVRLRVEPDNPALQWYLKLGFNKIADEQVNWHMEWTPPQAGQDG